MSPTPFLSASRLLAGAIAMSLLQGSSVLAATSNGVSLSPVQCAAMQQHHAIGHSNPVPCARLTRVVFDYHDFDGNVRQGAVVVLDAVAPQVESLFGELLLRAVPLAGAQPMEAFDGDDERSMAANNTSAFNGRPMTGGGGWSKHAYGVAIDINPLQNPYVSHVSPGSRAGGEQQQVLPSAGTAYLQRQPPQPGMAEELVGVFYDHGFLIWGGNWKQPIDYQHFEIGSRAFIGKLVALPPAKARAEFERYVARYRQCMGGAADRENHADHANAGSVGRVGNVGSDADDAPEDTLLRERCAARTRR